jgi:hypothetical protein
MHRRPRRSTSAMMTSTRQIERNYYIRLLPSNNGRIISFSRISCRSSREWFSPHSYHPFPAH